MISRKHRFLFVHIPRSGGTSISSQLPEAVRESEKHDSLFTMENKFDVSGFFKFTFIRNPWDIVISKYLSPYYSRSPKRPKIGKLANKSLLYFLKNYYPAPSESGDLLHDYFNPSKMDFIGRFETRERDLDYVSSKIGIKLDPSVCLRRIKPKHKHYTEYYDDETREIVGEKYAKDIEYFGYKFKDE